MGKYSESLEFIIIAHIRDTDLNKIQVFSKFQ